MAKNKNKAKKQKNHGQKPVGNNASTQIKNDIKNSDSAISETQNMITSANSNNTDAIQASPVTNAAETNNKTTKETPSKNPKISNKGNDLLKQFGLSDEFNPEFADEIVEKEAQEKAEKKAEKKIKGHVASHADTIGWNKPLVLLKNFLFGFFMGISDGTPGYSGGTTLTIIGFYQQLMHNIKLIFKPDVKKYFWKYIVWVLPFLVAWIATLYGFMQIVDVASKNNMGVVLVFLFGSFALFSIPLFLLTNKPKMVNYKDFIDATKKKEKWTIVHWVVIVVAFLLLVGVGIGARLIPVTYVANPSDAANPIVVSGVTFAENLDNWIDAGNVDPMNILFLLLAGMIAGFCMLIPGISGSLVLFMTTWYPKISQAVAGFTSNVNYLPWLVIVAAGMIIGIILSTFVVSYCLKRWEKIFYSASLGLIGASPIAIFTALSSYEYAQLSDGTTLGLALGMIVIAIIINGLIFIALNETKMINYPKYRIFNKQKTETKETA